MYLTDSDLLDQSEEVLLTACRLYCDSQPGSNTLRECLRWAVDKTPVAIPPGRPVRGDGHDPHCR